MTWISKMRNILTLKQAASLPSPPPEAVMPTSAEPEAPLVQSPEAKPATFYRAQLATLFAESRLAEAESLFHSVPAQLHTQLWFMLSGLRLGILTRNDHATGRFIAILCAAEHRNGTGLLLASRMLRQADRLDQADTVLARWTALFPESEQAWREAAAIARKNGQRELAADRLAKLAELPTASKDDLYDAITAAAELGRHDAARMLAETSKTPPAGDDPAALAAAAKAASTADQPDLAAEKLAQLAALTPDDAAAAVKAALALLVKKRSRARRIGYVLARLEGLRLRFPDHLGCYTATLDALREIDGFEQAEALAAGWAPRWGSKPIFVLSRLRVAEERGAWEDALVQIQQARAMLPPNPAFDSALVRVLAGLERYGDAETAAHAGLAEFPANRGLLREFARIAVRQGDLQLALERWLEAERQRPGDNTIGQELRSIRGQIANQGLCERNEAPPDAEEDILNRFESLGGTVFGCEFGMVQQGCNAGSVGLLKWSTYSIGTVTEILENQLADIGSVETTTLTTVRIAAGNEEYLINDTRHKFGAHTFIKVKDMPPERALAQGRRRFKFLAGKLMDDLKAAQRIIVFKAVGRVIEPELYRLLKALQAFGDHALLCVTKADEGNPAGTLREVSRGLYIGYISRFMKDNTGDALGIDIAGWRELCTKTEDAWNANAKDGLALEEKKQGTLVPLRFQPS